MTEQAKAERGVDAADEALLRAFDEALWLEDGLARASRAAYSADLRAAARWLAGRDVRLGEARLVDLRDYLAARSAGGGFGARSQARAQSALRRFYVDVSRAQARRHLVPQRRDANAHRGSASRCERGWRFFAFSSSVVDRIDAF